MSDSQMGRLPLEEDDFAFLPVLTPSTLAIVLCSTISTAKPETRRRANDERWRVGRAPRVFDGGSCSRSARCVCCCSAWLASIPQHAPARGPSCSLLHALKLPEHPPTRPSFGFLFPFPPLLNNIPTPIAAHRPRHRPVSCGHPSFFPVLA